MPKQCTKCKRPNYGGGEQCGRCLDKAVEKYFGIREGILREKFGPGCVYVLVDEVGNCPVWENICRDCDRCQDHCYCLPEVIHPSEIRGWGGTTEDNWGNEGGAN